MSIINELNLLKVISRDAVDMNGLQERFIAFDENSREILSGILCGLMNKDYIIAENELNKNYTGKGVIKLTDKGVEYLKNRM